MNKKCTFVSWKWGLFFLKKGNPIFLIKLGQRLPKSFSQLTYLLNLRFFLSYFLKKDDWTKAYAGPRLSTLPYVPSKKSIPCKLIFHTLFHYVLSLVNFPVHTYNYSHDINDCGHHVTRITTSWVWRSSLLHSLQRTLRYSSFSLEGISSAFICFYNTCTISAVFDAYEAGLKLL